MKKQTIRRGLPSHVLNLVLHMDRRNRRYGRLTRGGHQEGACLLGMWREGRQKIRLAANAGFQVPAGPCTR